MPGRDEPAPAEGSWIEGSFGGGVGRLPGSPRAILSPDLTKDTDRAVASGSPLPRPDAKLPFGGSTPRPHASSIIERNGVGPAARELRNPNRRQRVDQARSKLVRHHPVALLAVLTFSPTVNLAGSGEGVGRARAADDLLDGSALESDDLRRPRPVEIPRA